MRTSRQPTTFFRAGGAIALLLALACRDATAPTLEQRMAGTYDLTTTLTTHTYSVDCRPFPAGCRDTTVAVSGPTLYGTITVLDSVVRESNRSVLPISVAELHQSGDGKGERIVEYEGSLAVSGDTLGVSSDLYAPFGVLITLSGTVVGESIVGDVSWHTYLGCCAVDYVSGTFVARRR